MTLNSYKSTDCYFNCHVIVSKRDSEGESDTVSEEVMLLSLLSGWRILFVTVTYMRTMMILTPPQQLLLLFLTPLQNEFSTLPTGKLYSFSYIESVYDLMIV